MLLQVTDADVIKFLRMLTFLPLDEVDALEQAMLQPDYVPNTAQKRLAEAVTRWGCPGRQCWAVRSGDGSSLSCAKDGRCDHVLLLRMAAACRFVHGDEGLDQALKATEALRPGAATALDAATLEAIAGDAPSCSLAAAQVSGLPLIDVMVASGMLKSKGEVSRRRPAAEAVLQCCASWQSAAGLTCAVCVLLQVKRLIKGGGVYLNNAKVTEQDKVVQAEDLIDGKLLLLAAGKKNKMLVRISG